ncbi:MAG: hypothetical protein HXY18_05750, partial [Bryobacteraceae bacterium]|nr:hypothetical protein [Bryobacteraceae bacterium]
ECAVQWVGNYRISCQGSINQSTRVLLLFDALSGRELLEQFGLEFAWSPDGQVLASRGNIAGRTGRIATHRLPWPGAKEVDFPSPRGFAIRWSGGGIVVEHGGKTHSVAGP